MTHLMTLLKPTWSDIDASGRDLGRFGWPKVRPKGPPIPGFLVRDAPAQKISHGDGGRIHITLRDKMSIAGHDISRGTHLNPWTQSVRDIPEDDPIPRIHHHGWTIQVDPLGRRKLHQQRLLLCVVHTRFSFGEGLIVPDDVDIQFDCIRINIMFISPGVGHRLLHSLGCS